MRQAGLAAALSTPLAIALAVFGSTAASADCVSECSNAYQAATASCQERFGAAGQEVQLQQCLDAAQATFGTCSDACDSQD